MPVIAVINRKGGSGKSTLATHLAAWLAHQNIAVMLGDVDRQQSTRAWLKRRNTALPAIMPWSMDQKNVLRVPPGVTHAVLDTPGGLHGFELAKVIMSADAVLMPVCNSLFDRESAATCHAELMALPRIATGRCKLGVVGMRIDGRTHAGALLRAWAQSLPVPFLGVLREAQLYVKSLDTGETIFDMAGTVNYTDLLQWESILDWLKPIAKLLPPAPVATPVTPAMSGSTGAISTSCAASLLPAQGAFVHGDRLSLTHNNRSPENYAGPRSLLRH